MADLEARLIAAGEALLAEQAEEPRVDVASAIAAGRRRRAQRLQLASVAGAALLTSVVVAMTVSLRLEGGAPAGGRAARISASGSTTTTRDAPRAPAVGPATTTTARRAPAASASTTTTASQSQPSAPTSSTTSTTPTVDPAIAGVTTGTWVVGLDGEGLRSVSGSYLGQLAWSPTGDRLAVTNGDWVWKLPVDADDDRPVATVRTPDGSRCLDWSVKGELVWVSRTGEVLVAAEGAVAGTVISRGHATAARDDYSTPSACRWSPDGSLVAVTSRDGMAILRRDGSAAQTVPGVQPHWTSDVLAWSPDGRFVAAVRPVADPPSSELVVVEPGEDPFVAASFSTATRHGIVHLSWHPASTGVYVQVGMDSGSSAQLVDVVERRADPLSLTCCTRLDALEGGRFVGFSADATYGPRKTLTLVGAEDEPVILAKGRAPSTENSLRECRGVYLWDKRVAPTGDAVAFVARASYGPRCDSPVF